jgi:hypothetical protein
MEIIVDYSLTQPILMISILLEIVDKFDYEHDLVTVL